jgi:hypothetical protein
MVGDDSIGQQLTELGARPASDNEPGGEVQVRARAEVMRDAGRKDGEDGGGAVASLVEPRE